MDQVLEFFRLLFDTGDWPPRWLCGKWSEFHGWLYILSDVAIWLAYFIIPALIIFFIQSRPNIPFLPVFWLFGAFIILCGATHIIDAVIFWWPAYRVSALIRFLTALVSMVTVWALIRDLPKLLNFSATHPQLNESKEDEKALLQKIEDLESKIKELEGRNE